MSKVNGSKRLCLADRLLHNNSKVRYAANVDLKLLCDAVTHPKDHRIRKLGRLFKKTVSDSDAHVQDKALDALIAYLKAADAHVAKRYAKEVCDAVMTICLTCQPNTLEKARMVFLLWVELEAVKAFMATMEKAVKSQVTKAVLLAIDFMILVLSEFGLEIRSANRIAKVLLEILDHQDQNVIDSSKGLTRELCRWIGMHGVKSLLYGKMSDTMKEQLDVELPTVKLVLHPPRRLRSAPKVCNIYSLLTMGTRSGPSEESAAEKISQLEKVSLSDPKEQNKKNIDGEDGNNKVQKSLPAWCAADYFERLSPEELMAVRRPYQEWVISHTCTTCGVLDERCRCKRLARLQNMVLPPSVDSIYYGSSTKFRGI